MSADHGEAEERPDEAEPRSDVDDPRADAEAEPDVDPRADAEARAAAGAGSGSRARPALLYPPALYFAGFAVVLISFAALALGGLALLGRGIDASPTGFFWVSIVLSVVALGLGLAALFALRR